MEMALSPTERVVICDKCIDSTHRCHQCGENMRTMQRVIEERNELRGEVGRCRYQIATLIDVVDRLMNDDQ
jgi:hypothetical protein